MDLSVNNSAYIDQESFNNRLRDIRHDVNNQLSNILISLEQLRYEMPHASEDCLFYMDTIAMASAKITDILRREA